MASWRIQQFFTMLFLSMVGFSSCSPKNKEDIPKLSRQETIDLMIERVKLEQKINRLVVMRGLDSAHLIFTHFEQQLLDSAGVSRADFKESIEYYQADEEDFIKMYDQMIDSLMLEDAKSGKQKPKAPKTD